MKIEYAVSAAEGLLDARGKMLGELCFSPDDTGPNATALDQEAGNRLFPEEHQ